MNYDQFNQDSDEEEVREDQDGLRARSEQAIGELAQTLIESPTVHNAIAAAFGAREKAIEAQHAAMSALNLPSASDVERLERRLRSFSQRLEDVEEQLDEANRELSSLRRRLAAQRAEADRADTEQAEADRAEADKAEAEKAPSTEKKSAKAVKAGKD
jgi:TolA-binding protein